MTSNTPFTASVRGSAAVSEPEIDTAAPSEVRHRTREETPSRPYVRTIALRGVLRPRLLTSRATKDPHGPSSSPGLQPPENDGPESVQSRSALLPIGPTHRE